MLVTLTDYRGRHWVTHNANGLNYSACGSPFGPIGYPPVEMPSACITCKGCADQATRYEMAMLNANSTIRVQSTRTHEIEG